MGEVYDQPTKEYRAIRKNFVYQIVTYTYMDQAETYACQNAKNLIFQLNYFKENRTDIQLVIVYQLDNTTKRLKEALVLEMDKNG